MIIRQEEPSFKPITITFDNKVQAKAFFDLVDALYGPDPGVAISVVQKKILGELSDAKAEIQLNID